MSGSTHRLSTVAPNAATACNRARRRRARSHFPRSSSSDRRHSAAIPRPPRIQFAMGRNPNTRSTAAAARADRRRCDSAASLTAARRRGRRRSRRRRFSTSITRFCRSLGLTPGMRAACASVRGRMRASFCRASNDSERISSYGSAASSANVTHAAQLVGLRALALEVAGVLDLELRAHHGVEREVATDADAREQLASATSCRRATSAIRTRARAARCPPRSSTAAACSGRIDVASAERRASSSAARRRATITHARASS